MRIFLLFLLSLSITSVSATHMRAGEITYKRINGLTYEITITTYTYSPSNIPGIADRCELVIKWGDNKSDTIPRLNGTSGVNANGDFCAHRGILISPDIRKNSYTAIHTYAAQGIYKVSLEDPNRNAGVINIENSVNTPFYVETLLQINSFVGINNSPTLLNPPVDNACVGKTFLHNPGGYDMDGDSLSYQLVACKQDNGLPIPSYVLPPNLTISATTGDVIWDKPQQQGEYNMAILIEEWRNNQRIGYIIRDMQIMVIPCDNSNAPEISKLSDTCVIAGSTLQLPISATDTDNNTITLSATGGPFFLTPGANFTTSNGIGYTSSMFSWATSFEQVNKNPYHIFFKATDNDLPVHLIDLHTWRIHLIAPPVKKVTITPYKNTMQIKWEDHPCTFLKEYRIYRRVNSSGFIPSPCETGIPTSAGYTLIGQTTDTTYTDINSPSGLIYGETYCYIILAIMPDGSESIASEEICATPPPHFLLTTQVDVLKTDNSEGEIHITWHSPLLIDSMTTLTPFTYHILRTEDGISTLVDSTTSLLDTSFIDKGLNTAQKRYTYTIILIQRTATTVDTLAISIPAYSLYLSGIPSNTKISLSWKNTVPWKTNGYIIYKKNTWNNFDSLAFVYQPFFTDTALLNNTNYCYKVMSIGNYPTTPLPVLVNQSQEICLAPLDDTKPCPAILSLSTDCKKNENNILWQTVNTSFCKNIITGYTLYYTDNKDQEGTLLYQTTNPTDTTFTHILSTFPLGCYWIIVTDSNHINSEPSPLLCQTTNPCTSYTLPNVFTPNKDQKNDYFVPISSTQVEQIDITIYNRWGGIVFKTNNPNIEWDGTHHLTKKDCPDGVYFYLCKVEEITLNGIIERTITGYINLLR